MADAGWYPDAYDANSQHYFDGESWTGHRRPNPPSGGVQDDSAAVPTPPPADLTVRRSDLPQIPTAPAQGALAQGALAQGWQPPAAQPQGGWQQGPQTGEQLSGGWAPAVVPPQQWWSGAAAAAPAPDKRTRTRLIVAGAAAVIVAAGVTTWVLWPDDPAITYDGKEVASADRTLSTVEKAVAAAVARRNGASNGDTRCYFVRPRTQPSGSGATDVRPALACGPVLFVDGDPTAAYLSVPLTATTSGDTVTLSAASEVDTSRPAALPTDLTLVRPDGRSAPKGAGGLAVPQPPAAQKDVIVSTSLASSSEPPSVTGAVMASRNTKVVVSRAGYITRYGTGDGARSAPTGQRLIAFTLFYSAGDVGSGGTRATLRVNGSPRALPSSTGDYYVLAVDTDATVDLLLDADGYRQTIGLPDGKPGTGNIAVLQRAQRLSYVNRTFDVPMQASLKGRTVRSTYRTTVGAASLDFWAPGNTRVHASSVRSAILSLKLNYVDSAVRGKTFGWDTGLVKIKLPNGTLIGARNVAVAKGRIQNIWQVPADFTTGKLIFVGSAKSDGLTVTVRSSKNVDITIGR